MKKLALSHSKINTFDICPNQFKLMYIDKTYEQDSDNPYFVKGQKLHKQLEDYVVAKLSDEPTEKLPMSAASRNALPILDKLIKIYPDYYPEQKICLDTKYNKCAWFDNKKAYYRAIIDFLAMSETEAVIIDHKSGKVRDYDEFGGQLHLTAFLLMMMFPKLTKVTSAYLYLEHKQTVKIILTRDDLPALKKHFEGKYVEINSEEEYAPKRNSYCNFCRAKPHQCKFKKAAREL